MNDAYYLQRIHDLQKEIGRLDQRIAKAKQAAHIVRVNNGWGDTHAAVLANNVIAALTDDPPAAAPPQD